MVAFDVNDPYFKFKRQIKEALDKQDFKLAEKITKGMLKQMKIDAKK